jgi:hypothetical protein
MATAKRQILVIQPFDKPSTEGVYQLIRSASLLANATVSRVDSVLRADSDVLQSIQSAIQSASLLIADVTNTNPNVMFEVGFAQAQNKPLLLVANSSRSVPFDLTRVRIIIYDVANPNEFVDRLAKAISSALENPEAFLLARAAAGREKRPSVFISYSHSDREYLDRLLVHLRPLERDGLLDLWVDTHLRAGDKWKKEIEKALNRATVAVLLVSADFLASDFITDNELPPILRRAEERGTRIVPLIVKPCRFARDKDLRHFQAVNDPRHSLALLSQGEQEVLYDRVAAEVEKWLQRA